jgi:hypothetical protein
MSLQITKIKGIPIRLHFTLIIVFFLTTWTLSASLMPEIHPGLSRRDYWIIGIFGAGTSFISILLHELAHSIVALRYGLKVRQIILFIFGGVSDIEEGEASKDFHKEFKIAIVGPITSFVIAAILGLAWWILLFVSQTDRIKIEEIMIPKDELIVMRSSRSADDALRRMFRENKSRVFICEEDKEEQEVKKHRRQKLVGLISKTDILNVAKEREEFDKAVEKLNASSSNSNDGVTIDSSNFGKTVILRLLQPLLILILPAIIKVINLTCCLDGDFYSLYLASLCL